MKFCIVSPPTVTEFEKDLAETDVIVRLAEHAPVGVLTLMAVLQEKLGSVPELVEMNMLYYDYLRSEDHQSGSRQFYEYAIAHLLEKDFDVIGFGTICSSYPLTLRIAEGLHQARPDVRILLGGPQASAVDVPTLRNFPFVDFVVRFEAEESLPHLLRALEHGEDLSKVNGITYRHGSEILRTESAPVIADLDALPLPAYEHYPYLEKARYIPLELGRGCPYACTFCSTNEFFRRRFRLKTPSLIVEQMTQLKAQYGIAIFDLIHDMFTVNRKKVVEFCQALLESDEKFHWNCSARTDRVDDELLALMEKAGCRGIFFGIETGSERMQQIVKKRIVLSDAMARIRTASELGMQTAVSLITGFPDETNEDFHDTVDFFVKSLRFENATPQLHILAPLPDTPIHRQYREELSFDDIFSDMSHQGWDQDPQDRQLIASHPDVFPNFFAVPTPLDRAYIKEVRSFLLCSVSRFRYLLVTLHRDSGNILDVFREFEQSRKQHASSSTDESVGMCSYYQTDVFRNDFIKFVAEQYVPQSCNADSIRAILTYSSAFDEVMVEDPAADMPDSDEIQDGKMYRVAFKPETVPVLADEVRLLHVNVDFHQLMQILIEEQELGDVARRNMTLASRKLPGRWPEVLQLSPMSAAVLELCDGVNTVDEIIAKMGELPSSLAGVPRDKAAFIGFELLRHDGLVAEASA